VDCRRLLPWTITWAFSLWGAKVLQAGSYNLPQVPFWNGVFGCNIGAYFGGVASFSLHGWLWLAGALIGTPIGVKLRTRLKL
jgi:hypothetical protein